MRHNYFVIDANVIYDYFGREKLGLKSDLRINKSRLNRLLNKSNSTLFISSSVLAEILIHFRNNLDKIYGLIFFLEKHVEYILTTSTDCADKTTVDSIIRAKNVDEIKNILDKVLKSKIQLENYVVYVFAGVISSIIGGILLESIGKTAKNGINIGEYSEKAMDEIVCNRDIKLAQANRELINYYSQNKESTGMKKIYDNFLKTNFQSYEKQAYKLNCDMNPSFFINEEAYYQSLTLSKTPDKMYSTMAKLLSDFNKVNDCKNQINEKVNDFCSEWYQFDKWQLLYISDKFNYYLSQIKFRKNDVFDTFFLGAFKDQSIIEINKNCSRKGREKCSRENFHLLSFDTSISKFLYVIDKKGALIIDRIRCQRLFPEN